MVGKDILLDLYGQTDRMVYFAFVLAATILVFHHLWRFLYSKGDREKKNTKLIVAKTAWMLTLVPLVTFSFFRQPYTFCFIIVGFFASVRYIIVRVLGYRVRTSAIEAGATYVEFVIFILALLAIRGLLQRYAPFLLPPAE